MTIADGRFWPPGPIAESDRRWRMAASRPKPGRVHVAVAIMRVPNHSERKDNCGVRMKTGWSTGSGSLLK